MKTKPSSIEEIRNQTRELIAAHEKGIQDFHKNHFSHLCKREGRGMSEHEIKIPKLSEWYCELFGAGPEGMILRPVKGNEPNFFWRWMQYVFFGNKWVRRAAIREVGNE